MLTPADLHDYQRQAITFIHEHPRCALWIDLGLGKTVATLSALSDLADGLELGRVLVVAPLRVARTTWPAEIEKWTHLQHLDVQPIAGNAAERIARLRQPKTLNLIHFDLLPWLSHVYRNFRKCVPWDTLVIDESSLTKGRGVWFKVLRRIAPKVSRVIELTATPAAQSMLSLWPQFFLLDGGDRLGTSFTGFQQEFFQPADYHGYRWAPKAGAKVELQRRIADITLTLRAEDHLKLDKPREIPVEVRLSPAQLRAYREFEKTYVYELANGGEIDVASAVALSSKLLQLANGTLYDAERGRHHIHDAKLDALRQIVAEAQGEPILIAYGFQSDRDRILDAFPDARVLDQRQATINDWNAGRIPLLLAHPKSAAHGLNLQQGGRIVVWYGLSWSVELTEQFNARLHRQGQQRPVIIYRLIALGTLDETVISALETKQADQVALLQAMRRRVDILKQVILA